MKRRAKSVKKNPAAVALAKRRASKLGPVRRREIAETAARARWKQ